MRTLVCRPALLAATSVAALCLPHLAKADDSSGQLSAIERQIKSLTAELAHMKHDMAVRNEEMRAVQRQAAHAQAAADARGPASPSYAGAPSFNVPPGYALVPATTGPNGTVVLAKTAEPQQPKLPLGTFMIGDVRVTLGGFIEETGIYRSRNEVADIASSFNTGIPLPNSALYHENEYRQSARQSRFSLMAQDNPDPVTTLTGVFEGDLISAGSTANSNESNSYNPRVRHAFAVYDRSDWGMYFLGGQTWSLATMDKTGIGYMLSSYNIPSQIDAQYMPGFVWTRTPQFRVAKSFDNNKFWLAASVENPQTVYYAGPNGNFPTSVGTVNDENPGGSTFASTTNYSTEVAPDVIVKASADPGWGHYEVFGIGRFLHDRISEEPGHGESESKTVLAGGIGGGMILPILPKYLDFQANVLAGRGIGRYGTSQLPDSVIGPDGTPDPLGEVMGMVGLISHPLKSLDIYAYGGTEQVGRKYFDYDGKAYGYGNPLYENSSCETELGSSADCVANTSGIVQGTIGAWWRFEHGPYGTMQIGPQYSYTHRSIYSGVGPTPKTDENMVFLSFRYYPFQ
jgi:hypothetical protein